MMGFEGPAPSAGATRPHDEQGLGAGPRRRVIPHSAAGSLSCKVADAPRSCLWDPWLAAPASATVR